MIGKILKAGACLIGGLLTAEGVCIVGNALAEDLGRAKAGFDIVVDPKPPKKLPKEKKGWWKRS